jgi:hypothetical protein
MLNNEVTAANKVYFFTERSLDLLINCEMIEDWAFALVKLYDLLKLRRF